jgi:hypothetical protein
VSSRAATLLAWCLAAILLIMNVASMRHLSITYDEPRHFRYGQNILNLDSTRFDDSKMPVSALNALPAWIGSRVASGDTAASLERLETGRYATVLFWLLLGGCVFLWARDLYGPAGALLSLSLYLLDPNLLAHSQLVTTDLYAAGGIALALLSFWRFLSRGGVARGLVAALLLGVAQLTKYTALALLPLYVVIAVGFYWRDIRTVRLASPGAASDRRDLARGARRSALWVLVFLSVTVAVINVGFLFNRTGTRFGSYQFRSELFRIVQRRAGAAARLPVPVPYPYLEGLDWVIQRERTGEGYGPIYLLGELRQARGFNGYFLYATLFKEPLAAQLLVIAAIVSYVRRRRRVDFWRNEWVIVCPVLFFTIYFNFLYRAQIGIRYFLVVFPLLYVFAGSLLAAREQLTRRMVAAVVGGVGLTAASVLSYAPFFLAYFNELVPQRVLAYRILADSNIDWRQHLWYLARYRAVHPDVIVEPDRPRVGTILVGVNSLTGVAGDPERFRWLRENFTPVDHIARAVLVYHVTPAALARLAAEGRLPGPGNRGR